MYLHRSGPIISGYQGWEATSIKATLEVRVDSQESRLSSSNMQVRELEPQLALTNSESDTALTKLS